MSTVVVRDVTEAAFAQDVLETSKTRPVVVDFWAPWCGPCRQLSPLLERLAARYGDDVDVVKVNVDQAPNLSRALRIQGIPAVKAFRDGKVVSEFVGLQPEATVDRFFAALAPSQADRLVAQALAASDGQRETLLRQALELDAGHAGATVALAQVLSDRGEDDAAVALLQRVPSDDDARRLLAELRLRSVGSVDLDALRREAEAGDAGARLRLGRALAAAGKYDEALPELVAAVRHPATREEARAAVLEVFALAGDGSALTRAWRPKLASALF